MALSSRSHAARLKPVHIDSTLSALTQSSTVGQAWITRRYAQVQANGPRARCTEHCTGVYSVWLQEEGTSVRPTKLWLQRG